MKACILLCSLVGLVKAQTIITKAYPVKAGQEINLKFDYPQMIKISTWDKSEISIQASVTINNGKNDSSFVLQESSNQGLISISNAPFKNLPHSYTLTAKGQTKIFGKKEILDDYIKNNGLKDCNITSGNTIDVVLEIKVPAKTITNLKSVYGMVELKHFNGPATIIATYGGIDASLSEKEIGDLFVSANYGEIYSNLHLDITDKTNEAFHTAFKAKYGTGASITLESNYGNIYLRKAL